MHDYVKLAEALGKIYQSPLAQKTYGSLGDMQSHHVVSECYANSCPFTSVLS